MMSNEGWQLEPAECRGVFTRTEVDKENMVSAHKGVSDAVDALCGTFLGKSGELAPLVNAVYNRVLTANMTAAETQVANAIAGGREAVNAYDRGNFEMANQVEAEAVALDEFKITDGKKV